MFRCRGPRYSSAEFLQAYQTNSAPSEVVCLAPQSREETCRILGPRRRPARAEVPIRGASGEEREVELAEPSEQGTGLAGAICRTAWCSIGNLYLGQGAHTQRCSAQVFRCGATLIPILFQNSVDSAEHAFSSLALFCSAVQIFSYTFQIRDMHPNRTENIRYSTVTQRDC